MEIGSLTRMDAGATVATASSAGMQQGTVQQGNAQQQETQRKASDAPQVAAAASVATVDGASEQKADKVAMKPLHFLPTAEELKTMSYAMNRFVEMLTADLKFEVHEKTHEVMVKFVNTRTGEVLKEYPPKEYLDMIARIRDYVGMMIDKKI
ncbi:flagellar protein FlaG [Anaeromusa acidaminophila]|uniref:flagellar protein FlaG n=1 Tax=Anaeromusa acidaminophila TaxID=81464 RepID=UPI00036C55F6|nr:flagellar protein FlaG [Anaeromusa acidaminophila]